jgi:hypothetical protein
LKIRLKAVLNWDKFLLLMGILAKFDNDINMTISWLKKLVERNGNQIEIDAY